MGSPRVRTAIAAVVFGLVAWPSTSLAGGRLSFSIEAALSRPQTPAAEARLAGWNSSLGRVAYAMAREQATLGAGGLVGHSMGVAVRFGFRPHLRPEIISAAIEQGVGMSERSLTSIHWPWEKETPGRKTLSLEEQISIRLGRLLELR